MNVLTYLTAYLDACGSNDSTGEFQIAGDLRKRGSAVRGTFALPRI